MFLSEVFKQTMASTWPNGKIECTTVPAHISMNTLKFLFFVYFNVQIIIVNGLYYQPENNRLFTNLF